MSRVSLAKEPMQLVLKPVGFDKKRFEYEFNAVDDSPPVHRFCARIFVTDYMSPSPKTLAGELFQETMKRLYDSGSSQVWPKQGIDIFQILSELLAAAATSNTSAPMTDCQYHKLDVNLVAFRKANPSTLESTCDCQC